VPRASRAVERQPSLQEGLVIVSELETVLILDAGDLRVSEPWTDLVPGGQSEPAGCLRTQQGTLGADYERTLPSQMIDGPLKDMKPALARSRARR
jgi:hypothetical protein